MRYFALFLLAAASVAAQNYQNITTLTTTLPVVTISSCPPSLATGTFTTYTTVCTRPAPSAPEGFIPATYTITEPCPCTAGSRIGVPPGFTTAILVVGTVTETVTCPTDSVVVYSSSGYLVTSSDPWATPVSNGSGIGGSGSNTGGCSSNTGASNPGSSSGSGSSRSAIDNGHISSSEEPSIAKPATRLGSPGHSTNTIVSGGGSSKFSSATASSSMAIHSGTISSTMAVFTGAAAVSNVNGAVALVPLALFVARQLG